MLDLPPDLPPVHLTFADSFERFDHATGPWRTTFKWDGIGAFTLPDNGERQLYVDPTFKGAGDTALGLDPFRIEDGALIVSAAPTPAGLLDQVWGYPYLSGMLSTFGHHAQTYGYVDIRARLPVGQGLWTAFWLMPVEPVWPPEIDILEVLGHAPDRLWMNLHTTVAADRPPFVSASTDDLSADFHDFGLSWRPDRITWFVDGEALQSQPTPGDLHDPMHLLITLAVGGTWPGLPDATTPFPAELVIDRVRIFQFDDLAEPQPNGANDP